MWAGLALSYTVPALPPSFAILAVATGGYALVLLSGGSRRRSRSPVPLPVDANASAPGMPTDGWPYE